MPKPRYELPNHNQQQPHDKGDMNRLEREVAEIKQTTKETNTAVTELSKNFIRLETILSEGNKTVQLQIHQVESRSKSNEERLDELENASLDKRVSKLEDYLKWIVLLILGAVATGLLNLIIK